MLEALLKEHGGELLSSLTGAGGLDQGQAENLLPPALSGIGDALQGGGLDLGSLLGGGGAGDLLQQLNIGDIASSAGLSEDQASSGLASLIPAVMSLLGNQAGGAEDLLSMLGGGGEGASGALGAIGNIAGKLFGK
ncbi:MAG: hypothetical protein AB8G23_20125 [Myxococcota bacterium]